MQTGRLLELTELSKEEAKRICGVLCDIDDTITLHGRIIPQAFAAMAQAQEAGLAIIPVTGRPAGWVDHLARMWPVQGVVGENGGLWFFMAEGKLQRRFLQSIEERAENRRKLDHLAKEILQAAPGCALASDQPYRELDLAIDFCEDVPPVADREATIDRILDCFGRAGATAKASSIHVNGWFGSFDKLSGFQRLITELNLPGGKEDWAYIGDSANDAPMFAHFPLSVGVANVDAFLPRIPVWPKYRTEGEGGHGFAQLINRILELRAG